VSYARILLDSARCCREGVVVIDGVDSTVASRTSQPQSLVRFMTNGESRSDPSVDQLSSVSFHQLRSKLGKLAALILMGSARDASCRCLNAVVAFDGVAICHEVIRGPTAVVGSFSPSRCKHC
jgi:hypothetical protein